MNYQQMLEVSKMVVEARAAEKRRELHKADSLLKAARSVIQKSQVEKARDDG